MNAALIVVGWSLVAIAVGWLLGRWLGDRWLDHGAGLMTRRQAAKALGVSVAAITALQHDGGLPAASDGGATVLVPGEAVRRLQPPPGDGEGVTPAPRPAAGVTPEPGTWIGLSRDRWPS